MCFLESFASTSKTSTLFNICNDYVSNLPAYTLALNDFLFIECFDASKYSKISVLFPDFDHYKKLMSKRGADPHTKVYSPLIDISPFIDSGQQRHSN